MVGGLGGGWLVRRLVGALNIGGTHQMGAPSPALFWSGRSRKSCRLRDTLLVHTTLGADRKDLILLSFLQYVENPFLSANFPIETKSPTK
jgi:hypothetical protein